MFLNEINQVAGNMSGEYYSRNTQLHTGLQAMLDNDEPGVRGFGPSWDEDRLIPSGVRLRSVTLMLDGEVTGADSLAQITTPANKERIN